MPQEEKKKLPSIQQQLIPFPLRISADEKELLLRARGELGETMNNIVRHAVFEIYLPQILKKKK